MKKLNKNTLYLEKMGMDFSLNDEITKETILNLINSISKNQYTNIEYIERI